MSTAIIKITESERSPREYALTADVFGHAVSVPFYHVFEIKDKKTFGKILADKKRILADALIARALDIMGADAKDETKKQTFAEFLK